MGCATTNFIKNSGLLHRMVSLRATLAALASAGVLALGCGGDSRNQTIPATTLEQEMAQLETPQGKNYFLVTAAKKGLIGDAHLLHQALEMVIAANDTDTARRILDTNSYTPLLDVDQALQAANLFTDAKSHDYLLGLHFLVRRGEQERAKKEYDRIVQNPEVEQSRSTSLAEHAERFGDYERAIKILEPHIPDKAADIALRRIGAERAIKVYTDAHLYLSAFTFAKEQGMVGRAREVLADGFAFYAGKENELLSFAELLEASGKTAEANGIRFSVAQKCQADRDYRCAGAVAEAGGRFDDAMRFFEQAGQFHEAARAAEKAGKTERAHTYDRIGALVNTPNY